MSLPEHANGHESAIKTPRQLLITVILAFLIPIAIIILLVNLVGASIRTGAGSDGQSEEAIARRIQPVAGFKLVDANAPKALDLQTCDRTACYAETGLPAELVAAMQGGQKLNITFQNMQKQPVTLPMSLIGFTAAFDQAK